MAMEAISTGMAEWLRQRIPNSGASSTPVKYRCELCRDTGQVITRIPGDLLGVSVRECRCAIERRNKLRIERSGLADVLSRYTFDAYQTTNSRLKGIKAAALRYAEQAENEWFVIIGRPGSGKTHICTAIINRLMERGFNCKYMLWRDEVRELKALVNDNDAYCRKMDELKRIDVLYIDDFLKGRPTDGDLNVAFELLNSRYNQRKLTVISGERSVEQVMDMDEAIGSRMYERSKHGYCFETPGENWRLA